MTDDLLMQGARAISSHDTKPVFPEHPGLGIRKVNYVININKLEQKQLTHFSPKAEICTWKIISIE